MFLLITGILKLESITGDEIFYWINAYDYKITLSQILENQILLERIPSLEQLYFEVEKNIK